MANAARVSYRANTSTICDTIFSLVPFLSGSRVLVAEAAKTLRLTYRSNTRVG